MRLVGCAHICLAFVCSYLLLLLTSTKTLNISHNPKLTQLPSSAFVLKSLTRLDVSFCGFAELSAEIGELVSLVYLDASHNAIGELAEGICKCVHLTVLNMSHNNIVRIPAALPLSLTKLESFQFDGNPVTQDE
mmetsp:Transcript_8151/g.14725  ORF Transcript_8151/g.14725 Transcript_8151/m.14725 type:complete len:134 (+) Transcript_8151:684-1085(+)